MSAVYFALAPNGDVLYIGRARNVRQRWRSHHRFDALARASCVRIAWYACSIEALDGVESALIQQYSPCFNRPWVRERSREHIPLAPVVSRERGRLAITIIKARIDKGWQQKDLQRATGLSKHYISELECGRIDPRWSIVKRIAIALRVSVAQLAEETRP